MRVKQFQNIGFAVGLSGLSDEDSLKLQALGLGGRRAFGGGFFVHGPLPEGALAQPQDLEVRA